MGRVHDQTLKKVAWNLAATPEAWAAHVQRMREAGDPEPNVSYEEMREFALSEDYTITLDQNSHSRLSMPLLRARTSMTSPVTPVSRTSSSPVGRGRRVRVQAA